MSKFNHMKLNKTKLLHRSLMALALAVLVVGFLAVKNGRSQTMPYYSGDAVNYEDKVVFGSANSGYLEVFVLEGREIRRGVKVKLYNSTFNEYHDFSDLKLSVEGGRLYVYAISEYTLVKYDFSDLQNLSLVAKQTNTYWDWYYRIDKFGDNIGTVSKNGVKIINSQIEVIDSFAFAPTNAYSVRANNSRSLFFGISDSVIQIYNRDSRSVVREIPLNFNSDGHYRKIYFDAPTDEIYAIDDYYIKKFSTDGRLLNSFKHLSAPGYDAESTLNNPYVYFSNGFGVVKMTKSDFKLSDYAYATNLGGPQGWAMGLKAVDTSRGDVLVLFNNTNILVLDKNLDKIASVRAEEQASNQAREVLYLDLDHAIGTAGGAVNLTGAGYWPNEGLAVDFAGRVTNAVVDKNGRLNLNLTVPTITGTLPKRVDIKVDGLDSEISYSISFTIQ